MGSAWSADHGWQFHARSAPAQSSPTPPTAEQSSAKAAAALEALGAASAAAQARGVDAGAIERSLLRTAAELHMLQP